MTYLVRAAAAALALAMPAVALARPVPSLAPAPTPLPPGVVTVSQVTLGYTYYNRPGADLQLHDADVADCAAEAARTISMDEELHNGADQGVLGLIIGGAIQKAAFRGTAASGLENCMVVRGWRVVKLPDEEGKALAALPADQLSAKLGPWIGAEQPHGEIVRVWANEAANAVNQRFSLRPDHVNDGLLSLTEATSAGLKQFKTPERPADTSRDVLDPKWPKKPLKPTTLATAPAGSAILLVQIKGLGLRNGIGIIFNRMGPEPGVYPSRIDHGPDAWPVIKGLLFSHKGGDIAAVAVPAGRWRIFGMGVMPTVNFCLGSPSFEVKENEVVYAGSFDLGAPDLGPDLDLAPAKAWLGAAPQAAAVRAAVYTNGSRGVCGNNAIYALEVKGAPFEPGYAWGGALQPLAKAPPAPAVAAPAPASSSGSGR